MSFFEKVELLPEDPILSLPLIFAADPREKKVNLGIGVYRDDRNQPHIFSSVRKAENIIHSQELNKEYLPIEGNPSYLQGIINLIFGIELAADHISAIQTVGGTAALRIGSEFLVKQGHRDIYLSDPTWPNHTQIFQKGGMNIHEYPYYDYLHGNLNFESLCLAIEKMPSGSVILLQANCHNPTGVDLSKEQWKKISEILKKQRIIPFFDLAYQGLGVNLEEDVWPIRFFALQGHEMLVASSYSKNFGLYGERVGALSWYMTSSDSAKRVLSQFKKIVRGIYSSPPLHGGRLIATILGSKTLQEEWKEELEKIRMRIIKMRKLLVVQLKAKNLSMDFSFIEKQQGMFSMMGLTSEQVKRLKKDFGVYLLSNGRINISGLTVNNVAYVADSVAAVLS